MRPRPLRLLLALLIALAVTVLLLGGLSLRTWERLGAESLIAELTFDPLGPGRWRATLATGDRCHPRTFELEGEQWRLDARFLKWKPWANLLGLDARYRLERLESRHPEGGEGGQSTVSVHPLTRPGRFDHLRLARAAERYNPLVDTVYGSSAYEEIDPALRYRVYRSQWGLLVRTAPRTIGAQLPGRAVIRIDKACGRPEGWAGRIRRALDGLLAITGGADPPG
ncbi:MAG: hypothetical protein D6786_04955 [Gammaproteobacteria bacterium]|nr:MAG: hypothetical protein D6786_04955 [Gammaproteobacteria bacterium]